jgi:tartrate-resistant acid phosphatase type 5
MNCMHETPSRFAAIGFLASLALLTVTTAAPARAQRAQLDPFGRCLVHAKHESAESPIAVNIVFPALDFPTVGTHTLPKMAVRVAVALDPEAASAAAAAKPNLTFLNEGTLELDAFGEARVAGRVTFLSEGAPRTVTFDAVPDLARFEPATVTGAPPPAPFPKPIDAPSREDIVFCAIGDTGSGLAGQRRVAKALADLAASGPLDFVLLLGDAFYPKGPQSIDDPLWESRFESVYDRKKLDVPFYPALGDHDHMGGIRPLIDYSMRNRRWTLPAPTYTFEVESHGKRIAFFGADTKSIVSDIARPENRIANRMLVHQLEQSRADWKIVFGHHPFVSNGVKRGSHNSKMLAERMDTWFEKFGVDVYFCGDDHVLEILKPRRGVTHVVSGGGGGPELAYPFTWRDDTVFGHTGGGFAWVRFDGTKLEITLRDADGRVLFVHHLTKG